MACKSHPSFRVPATPRNTISSPSPSSTSTSAQVSLSLDSISTSSLIRPRSLAPSSRPRPSSLPPQLLSCADTHSDAILPFSLIPLISNAQSTKSPSHGRSSTPQTASTSTQSSHPVSHSSSAQRTGTVPSSCSSTLSLAQASNSLKAIYDGLVNNADDSEEDFPTRPLPRRNFLVTKQPPRINREFSFESGKEDLLSLHADLRRWMFEESALTSGSTSAAITSEPSLSSPSSTAPPSRGSGVQLMYSGLGNGVGGMTTRARDSYASFREEVREMSADEEDEDKDKIGVERGKNGSAGTQRSEKKQQKSLSEEQSKRERLVVKSLFGKEDRGWKRMFSRR